MFECMGHFQIIYFFSFYFSEVLASRKQKAANQQQYKLFAGEWNGFLYLVWFYDLIVIFFSLLFSFITFHFSGLP